MDDRGILYTENLDIGYDGKAVVEGVCMDLHPGEIMALIGPNGTGKSTLLKTLSGQLPPVRGEVFLKGRELGKIPDREKAQTMSLLLTGRADPELMTCEEVVAIGRYPYTGIMGRLSEHDREIMDYAMRLANAQEWKDQYFHQISDGQKQRVLLARAICQEPEVLILDEPTSFLDIRHKLELLQILIRLAKEEQVAVVVSLHEIELAKKVADTVICIREGQAEKGRDPAEVFARASICRLFDLTEEQYRWMYGSGESI